MADTNSDFATFSQAIAELITVTAPHVVEVASRRSLASGFVWRDNLVVTADETLAEEGDIAVELADGNVHAATLVGRDPPGKEHHNRAALGSSLPRYEITGALRVDHRRRS